MKKKYIKPEIIIIKTCDDDALMISASLYEYNKRDSVENIANDDDEDGPDIGEGGFIWND